MMKNYNYIGFGMIITSLAWIFAECVFISENTSFAAIAVYILGILFYNKK